MIIWIPGIPRPGGSKRHVGNGRLIEAGKHTKAWRKVCAACAREAMGDKEPMVRGLIVVFTFYMPRPMTHFRKTKRGVFLREDAPDYHTVRPDTTKLIRAVEDALTGIVWHDDSLIAYQSASKVYAADDSTGCRVEVYPCLQIKNILDGKSVS